MKLHHCLVAALLVGVPHAKSQNQWFVRQSGTTKSITSVAFGNGVFLATDGRPLLSEDNGKTWTRPSWGATDNSVAVFFNGAEFLILGNQCFFRSQDGKIASRSTYPGKVFDGDTGFTAAFLGGRWIIQGPHSGEPGSISDPVAYSFYTLGPDGIMNPITDFPASWGVAWVTAGGGLFMARAGEAIFTSVDGVGWTLASRTWFRSSPMYRNGVFIAVGYGLISADNGKTWTQSASVNAPYSYDGAAESAAMLALTQGSSIFTSADGYTWITQESGTTDWLFGIAFGKNTFVAVGYGGRITTCTLSDAPLAPVAPSIQIAAAVRLSWPSQKGFYYQRESSVDLIHWEPFGEPMPGNGGTMETAPEVTARHKFFRITVR